MDQTSPFLNAKGIHLLNVPHASDLARECITEDCYGLEQLHGRWAVADIGACYGEFSFFAKSRGHIVHSYEPSPDSKVILDLNNLINTPLDFRDNTMVKGAMELGGSVHYYRPHHPAGSGPDCGDGIPIKRQVVPMSEVIFRLRQFYAAHPVFVKMDCEGAEVEIFEHIDTWMCDEIKAVSMETHNHDAGILGKKLEDRGFSVKRFGTCPYPLPVWDSSMTGGLVIARR